MKALRMLLGLALTRWPFLLLALLCTVVTLLSNAVLLTLSAWFLASMAMAGAAATPFNFFLPVAFIRLLTLVRSLGRYAERLVSHDAILRLLAELRVRFFQRLVPLAPAALQQTHSADLFSRLRADIDTLDHFYLRMLLPAAAAMCVVLIGFVFLLRFDARLAWAILGLWLLAGLLLPVLTLKLGQQAGARQTVHAAALRRQVVDGLQGMEELRIYDPTGRHNARVVELSRALTKTQGTQSLLEGFSSGAVGLTAGLAMWLALLLGIPMVAEGAWSGSTLPMLAMFALVSFEAVLPLPGAWRMWSQTRSAADRVLEITATPPPVVEPVQPVPDADIIIAFDTLDLKIQGLCFTYPGRGTPALRDLNLELPWKSRVAIMGPAGSGKSTLLHLLLRFWDYHQGQIVLNGRPLREYGADQVRATMAVVSQHVFLFNASIAENLRLAAPGASDETLLAAARAAQLEDFIRALPQGLETPVGRFGARLSGGQARRLSVARALLKNAPILILDEPTEGLDPQTEQALWQTLAPLMQNRTVLLITHRPAGVEYMHRVHYLGKME
jgi:ATP-binding cassette, subfamily C, bacterial CydC